MAVFVRSLALFVSLRLVFWGKVIQVDASSRYVRNTWVYVCILTMYLV